MNKEEIKNIIPHRNPFLFVEEIIDYGEDYIIGRITLTGEEDFFKGHFPDYKIMPGVLMVEGLAQTAGVLLMKDAPKNSIPLFMGIEKVRFKKEVNPGDTIEYRLKVIQKRSDIYKLEGKVYKENKIAVDSILMVGMKRG